MFWSDAAAELRAFAEATGIPVYCRRAAQGAVPEDHPLAVRGAWKKPFTGRADVVLAVGFKFWSGEHFGAAPTWNEQATYIQVDATPAQIGWQVPAQLAVVGDPKLVLRQLSAAAAAPGPGARASPTGSRRWPPRAPTTQRLLDERAQRHRAARPDPSRPPGARALRARWTATRRSSSTPSP